MEIDPTPLTPAQVGVRFSQVLTAGGGTAPLHFRITNGGLPPGATLDPITGALGGIPHRPGTYRFALTATDSSTGTGPYGATRSFTLTVRQGDAARLMFLTQPSRASSNGFLPPFQVLVLDQFGNRLSGVVVRLALFPIATAGRAGFTPGSVLRAKSSDAVATFDRVAITARGRYELLAKVGPIVAFSDPFNLGLDGRQLD
jgi:hypothetical protein